MPSDGRGRRPSRRRPLPSDASSRSTPSPSSEPAVSSAAVSSPAVSSPAVSSPARNLRRKRRRRHRSTASSAPAAPTAPLTAASSPSSPRPSVPPSPSPSSSSDSDFLLTAAERRERRLLRAAPATSPSPSSSSSAPSATPAPLSSSPSASSSPHPPPIPGYHYDPQQRRYFKITVGHDFGYERRLQRLERTAAKSKAQQQPSSLHTSTPRQPSPHPTGDDSRLYAEWALHAPSTSLFTALTWRAQNPALQSLREVPVRRSLFAGGLSPVDLFTDQGEDSSELFSCLGWSAEHGLSYAASYLAICGPMEQHARTMQQQAIVHLTPRRQLNSAVVDVESMTDEKASGLDGSLADCPFNAQLTHFVTLAHPLTSCHVVPRSASTDGDSSSPSVFVIGTRLDQHSFQGWFRKNDRSFDSVFLSVPFGTTFASSPHPHFPSNPLVALAHTGGLSLIDSHSGRLTRRFRCGKSDQMATTWHPTDPSLVFSGGRDGCIRLFDVRSRPLSPPALQDSGSPQAGGVSMMRPVGAGHWGVVVATGGTLGLWDERRWGGKGVRMEMAVGYEEWRGEVGCGTTAVTPDGRLLMAGDDRAVVRVWEVKTGQMVKEIEGVRGSLRDFETGEAVGRRAGVVQHVVWLDEFQSMLVGSESGIACYALRM